MFVKVKDHKDLVRDDETGAILNVNNKAYSEYLIKRNSIMAEKEKQKLQEQEINTLKIELLEIKQLLYTLLEKKDATK